MRVIYTKYNRERLPKFQTETAILDVDDKIIVRKRALLPEGVEHIKNIYRNYELLQKQYNHVHISAASFTDNIITFEYVSKNSFSELLISAINENNHKKFYELLERFYCFLEGLGVYETDEFLSSRDFLTFFGEDISIGTTKCLPISNIDLTFDNVLLDGQENWSIIDYEWVFEFPIPIDYIFFRSVMEFIGKNKEVLIGFVEVSDIFKYFHFSNEILTHFEKMEQRFQDYVFGSKKVFSINDKYLKQQNSLSDLQQKLHNKEEDILNLQQELCSKEEILSNLQQELSNKEVVLSEKNALILRQQESIAKLNKNITELKNTINNKEGHIELLLEQERILHNITNSWEWRLVKKFHRVRDGIFPKGTKRRLLTKLALKTVKNPRVMLGRINSHNLKVFLRHLKTNELTMLENKVQNQINMYSPSEKQGIKLIEQVNVYEKIIFPKYEKPLVSIVIPVYNKWEYTYSCLRSIFEHTQNVSYEIILADDMSSDGTVNASSIVENIKIIRDGVNRGFLLNCNNAAKYAEGKYLLFLNNDTNVQPDWLKHLVDLIERDETIGMVGSKLVYGDGRLQEAGGIIWDDASGWNYGRLDDPEKPEYNYVKEVDYISGASIMIRTSLWNEIGGFDERYVPAYFEDSDLAFEVRKHGYKVVYQPKSVVVHFEGISHGTDVNSGVKSYQVKNREKFIEKWKDVLEKEHFKNAQHVFWARDKSRYKKTIVVIDHYVPHYDKDAGSRTTYQYLMLFVRMGFNVKFIGDNFYKHEPYTTRLEQAGIEVLYGNWYAKHIEDWFKQNSAYIDYVYLNRPHISIKYIDMIKKLTQAKVIYYGHDLHYLREMREYELTKQPELLKSIDRWKEIEHALISKSDVIYYPSQIEIEEIKKVNAQVNAKAIPAYIFDDVHFNSSSDFNSRKDLLFVGGFGHKPNIDAVLWFTQEIFPLILEKVPGIKFYIVGSNPPNEVQSLRSENIVVTGFVTDEQLKKYYSDCRIVVVPLRYGAGIKGKVVEAMYHGVPVITTSVGAEGLGGVEEILTVVDEPLAFAQKIVELYSDTAKLEDKAKHSYLYVKNHFSSENAKQTIQDDIKL